MSWLNTEQGLYYASEAEMRVLFDAFLSMHQEWPRPWIDWRSRVGRWTAHLATRTYEWWVREAERLPGGGWSFQADDVYRAVDELQKTAEGDFIVDRAAEVMFWFVASC